MFLHFTFWTAGEVEATWAWAALFLLACPTVLCGRWYACWMPRGWGATAGRTFADGRGPAATGNAAGSWTPCRTSAKSRFTLLLCHCVRGVWFTCTSCRLVACIVAPLARIRCQMFSLSLRIRDHCDSNSLPCFLGLQWILQSLTKMASNRQQQSAHWTGDAEEARTQRFRLSHTRSELLLLQRPGPVLVLGQWRWSSAGS